MDTGIVITAQLSQFKREEHVLDVRNFVESITPSSAALWQHNGILVIDTTNGNVTVEAKPHAFFNSYEANSLIFPLPFSSWIESPLENEARRIYSMKNEFYRGENTCVWLSYGFPYLKVPELVPKIPTAEILNAVRTLDANAMKKAKKILPPNLMRRLNKIVGNKL